MISFKNWFSFLVFYFFLSLSLISQDIQEIEKEIKTSFEIMDEVEQSMRLPEGLNKGRMVIINKKGNTLLYEIKHYKKKNDSLFIFENSPRGKVLSLLYNDHGEKIYTYEDHSQRMNQKKGKDAFTMILNSGFYFIDFKENAFTNDYASRSAGFKTIDKERLLKIENIPFRLGKYSKLDIYVDVKEGYKLKKINYYEETGVLIKVLILHYGDFLLKQKNKTARMHRINKLEMFNLNNNSISILEFSSNQPKVKLSDNLFKKSHMGN